LNSADPTAEAFRVARQRELGLVTVIVALMILGIGVVILYSIVFVGPLTSPGAQESFGLALALAFLMAGVAVHEVDRMYRVWPMGRRVDPVPPGPVTVKDETRFLKWLVVVAAAAAIAYLLGSLLAS
jgi:hypothetical protein